MCERERESTYIHKTRELLRSYLSSPLKNAGIPAKRIKPARFSNLSEGRNARAEAIESDRNTCEKWSRSPSKEVEIGTGEMGVSVSLCVGVRERIRSLGLEERDGDEA